MKAEPQSRVFRQVVTMEVVALVPPGVEVDGDLIAGADIEGEIRGAITDHDGGGKVWLVPGESEVGPIEELKP